MLYTFLLVIKTTMSAPLSFALNQFVLHKDYLSAKKPDEYFDFRFHRNLTHISISAAYMKCTENTLGCLKKIPPKGSCSRVSCIPTTLSTISFQFIKFWRMRAWRKSISGLGTPMTEATVRNSFGYISENCMSPIRLSSPISIIHYSPH